jgi:hypothetical protein
VIYIGIDWGEASNSVAMLDEKGDLLCRATVDETAKGVSRFTELVAKHASSPEGVVIGAETDRGLLLAALAAGGYLIYPINPMSASRYRDRHKVAGGKSDSADAVMLANIVRTDRQNHRPAMKNSPLAEEIKVLTRRHQDLIWERSRLGLKLRSILREYYPAALKAFGDDLTNSPCLTVLLGAPTPRAGKRMSQPKIAVLLRKGGRQRAVDELATKIHQALQVSHLELSPRLSQVHGQAAAATARILLQLAVEIKSFEKELAAAFEKHPDAEVILSFPGLGKVLGARLLAEFGDQPGRYADSKSRRNFSGMAPITQQSGKQKLVKRRLARKRRLTDACYQWADCAYKQSNGAKLSYRDQRRRGIGHSEALRALGNRLVGHLHACLRDRKPYDEDIAWPQFKAEPQLLSA